MKVDGSDSGTACWGTWSQLSSTISSGRPPTTPYSAACLSTPLRLADLRAGAAPVKAATVTYIVQGTGARANFEIRVARTRSGLAWSIWHHGERAARNSGTVPVRSLKAGGFARVVIESVGRVAGTGQRIPLFVHPSWDFQAALQLLPKVPSRRPIRSELVIRTTAG